MSDAKSGHRWPTPPRGDCERDVQRHVHPVGGQGTPNDDRARRRDGPSLRDNSSTSVLSGEKARTIARCTSADIVAEQDSLREQAAARHAETDVDWCRGQVVDVLATWDAADADQRTRLIASIFDHIEVAADPDDGALRLVGVPRDGWRSFFAYVVAQRETGDSRRGVKQPPSVKIAYRLAV